MIRKLVLTFSFLSLGGCSLSSHPAGGTTVVSVQVPQRDDNASTLNPLTLPAIGTLNCYAVNVTAPDIAPAPGCPSDNPGHYVGITAGAVLANKGSISVEVPNGKERTFQLIGYNSGFQNICFPFGSQVYTTGYMVAQVTVDISSNQVIGMQPSLSTTTTTEFTNRCTVTPNAQVVGIETSVEDPN